MSSVRLLLPAALLLAAVAGCGSARLIRSGPDGGVVAIPSNSNSWPFYYQDDARKLMAQQCPNGYAIVEQGEVVVGKKAMTSESTDRDRTATSRVTTVSDQKEWHITFRSLEAPSAVPPGPLPLPIVSQAPSTPSPAPPPPGLPSRPLPL
jgi:hypothetical protein